MTTKSACEDRVPPVKTGSSCEDGELGKVAGTTVRLGVAMSQCEHVSHGCAVALSGSADCYQTNTLWVLFSAPTVTRGDGHRSVKRSECETSCEKADCGSASGGGRLAFVFYFISSFFVSPFVTPSKARKRGEPYGWRHGCGWSMWMWMRNVRRRGAVTERR